MRPMSGASMKPTALNDGAWALELNGKIATIQEAPSVSCKIEAAEVVGGASRIKWKTPAGNIPEYDLSGIKGSPADLEPFMKLMMDAINTGYAPDNQITLYTLGFDSTLQSSQVFYDCLVNKCELSELNAETGKEVLTVTLGAKAARQMFEDGGGGQIAADFNPNILRPASNLFEVDGLPCSDKVKSISGFTVEYGVAKRYRPMSRTPDLYPGGKVTFGDLKVVYYNDPQTNKEINNLADAAFVRGVNPEMSVTVQTKYHDGSDYMTLVAEGVQLLGIDFSKKGNEAKVSELTCTYKLTSWKFGDLG